MLNFDTYPFKIITYYHYSCTICKWSVDQTLFSAPFAHIKKKGLATPQNTATNDINCSVANGNKFNRNLATNEIMEISDLFVKDFEISYVGNHFLVDLLQN